MEHGLTLKNIYNIFGWHWHGSAPTNSDINRMIAELTQSYKDHWYKSVHIEGGSKLSIFKLSSACITGLREHINHTTGENSERTKKTPSGHCAEQDGITLTTS